MKGRAVGVEVGLEKVEIGVEITETGVGERATAVEGVDSFRRAVTGCTTVGVCITLVGGTPPSLDPWWTIPTAIGNVSAFGTVIVVPSSHSFELLDGTRPVFSLSTRRLLPRRSESRRFSMSGRKWAAG